MKIIFIISISLSVFVTGGDGFFAALFDYGPKSANCAPVWSILWSPCYGTHQRTMFMHVPANCMDYNPNTVNFVQNGGVHTLDLAYKWLRKVNMSQHACGMCNFQVSCSRNCDVMSGPEQQARLGQRLFPLQPGVNAYGVTQRLCPGVDQSDACIADPNEAWNPATNMCQMWPPIRDQAMPDTVGPTKQIIQYNVPPTPCIFLGGKCYCCCYPYIPDVNTLKCINVG